MRWHMEKPFQPGEIIYGYQACELAGKVYIDIDGKGSEWLTNISHKDTAIFRYVDNREGFIEAIFHTQGSGTIRVCLDDFEVGTVRVMKDGLQKIPLKTNVVGAIQELKLIFEEPDGLKVISVILN
jgi:arabinoxylan arabinofuranohydrolase